MAEDRMAVLETAWPARISLRTAALILLAAGTASGSGPQLLWWGLVLAEYAIDVAVLAGAGVRQSRARRALGFTAPTPALVQNGVPK